jgi:hypothetical protein
MTATATGGDTRAPAPSCTHRHPRRGCGGFPCLPLTAVGASPCAVHVGAGACICFGIDSVRASFVGSPSPPVVQHQHAHPGLPRDEVRAERGHELPRCAEHHLQRHRVSSLGRGRVRRILLATSREASMVSTPSHAS